MHVYKFGGTSVGSIDRMKAVLDIIKSDDNRKIIVLSAMSGTTNALSNISRLISEGDQKHATELVENMYLSYQDILSEFDGHAKEKSTLESCMSDIFELIFNLVKIPYTAANEKIILAQGELLSSNIFHMLCRSRGLETSIINALDFMRVNHLEEPDYDQINEKAIAALEQCKNAHVIITQGYICKNSRGEIDNLKRGGSDYTATILGSLIKAAEIQIWTDIDGIHNNDPRIVENTTPIEILSYREAAELSYFGAKILHPSCVLPAEKAGVPIRLKSTMKPEANGTLISNKISDRPITALAAKDGITAIKIYSHRMLMAYGFLRKVFEVFEEFNTPVDMITTSEVAVSLSIDDTTNIDDLAMALQEFGEVEIEHGYSIVCVVGNALYEDKAYLNEIFEYLADIPIRMVSMGGSKYNISILVSSRYKNEALIRLNQLFQRSSQTS
ncbi:MAG: aspartate kinase [Bacteroidia bacterium]|nr:aspartate kinase [Bacteroidia bacterium]